MGEPGRKWCNWESGDHQFQRHLGSVRTSNSSNEHNRSIHLFRFAIPKVHLAAMPALLRQQPTLLVDVERHVPVTRSMESV